MCIEQNQTGLIEQLKKSFTFQLSLSSKELFHSNFLAWIADVDDDLFQKLIVGFIKDKNTTQLELKGKWSAEREYHNYDLCVLDDIIDDPDNPEIKGNIRLILENKVKSIPYKAQLDQYKNEVEQSIFSKINFHRRSLSRKKYPDYAGVIDKASGTCEQRINAILEELKKDIYNNNRHVKSVSNDCLDAINKLNKVHYVLLSLTENFPERQEIISSGWRIVSYESYAGVLDSLLKEVENGEFKTVCTDYLGFIKSFNSLYNTWCEDNHFKYYKRSGPDEQKAKTYDQSYLDAKTLRIHDIFLKRKVSVMAINIYQKLKNEPPMGVEPQIVFGDADNNILSKTEAFLGVGYGYLHGSPIVEIKYKPEGEKFMFIIQVQGDAYEHGIIWKDTTPEECWENAKSVENIKDWMSIDESREGLCYTDHRENTNAFQTSQKELFSSHQIFPEKPNTRSKNDEGSESSEQIESKGVPYYKYKSQNSFVYQSIDLSDEVTMSDIEGYMIDDIKRIIDPHNQKNY